MTLEDYLLRCEHQSTHVLVAHGDGAPRAEVHPIPHEVLVVLRQVWTKTYYDHQSATFAHAKQTKTMADCFRKQRPIKKGKATT